MRKQVTKFIDRSLQQWVETGKDLRSPRAYALLLLKSNTRNSLWHKLLYCTKGLASSIYKLSAYKFSQYQSDQLEDRRADS